MYRDMAGSISPTQTFMFGCSAVEVTAVTIGRRGQLWAVAPVRRAVQENRFHAVEAQRVAVGVDLVVEQPPWLLQADSSPRGPTRRR
jgi:hypothetical protein